MKEVEQVDCDAAETAVSAANVVSHAGYYELDVEAVAQAFAAHRHQATAELVAALREAAGLVYRIEAAGLIDHEAENFERWKVSARQIAPVLRAALRDSGIEAFGRDREH